MADYRAPLEDMRFILNDVFDVTTLWDKLAGLESVDSETADAILEEAAKICQDMFAPLNREADEVSTYWDNGKVVVPEGFHEAYQTFCDGGWVGLGGNPEYGGMGMPKSLVSSVEEMVQGSCMALGLAPMLTAGACVAINAHASEELKQQYLPNMYSGKWSGVMDLTEPHAGTDLGMIRTKAEPQEDGSYLLSGTKIFITWGEHDMAENIIHLVLAKLPGAPSGSKGISLFLVPKKLPDASNEPGELNGVSCGSIEKKMGIKSSATCVMNFDNAKGWLVGELNRGLACMFTMMNYERLVVGIQGIGTAEASYQTALEYAKDRVQGRDVSGVQAPDKPADPIICHADVRRMLMSMKAYNEGSRAFYTYVAQWLDIAKYSDVEEDKKLAEGMVALLTPVAKGFMTDIALDCAIHGQQVLGGHGYVREWGQEQFVRDIRITQLYEGTNGIQAMDLVGRKTVATKGALLSLFVNDVDQYLKGLQDLDGIALYVSSLKQAISVLTDTTETLLVKAEADVHAPGAAAVNYMHLFGHVAYAYMWVRMSATVVEKSNSDGFKQAKLATAAFYFEQLLPKIHSLSAIVCQGAGSCMQLSQEHF